MSGADHSKPSSVSLLREQAEEQVFEHSECGTGGENVSKDLVHELRVHQVELEIQNDELLAARNELEKSQKYLSRVFYHAPVGYVVLDPSGGIKEINQAGRNILGRVAGMPGIRMQTFIGPGYEHRFSGILRELLTGGEPQRQEVKLATMRGEARWVRVDLALLESVGTATILCTLVPMDREIEARESLARSNEELEQLVQDRTRDLEYEKFRAEAANRAKTTFLANMSHEIRTPLNGVLSMLELLEKGGLAPSQQELVELAALSGNNLLDIIGDILDLAKIESESRELLDEEFDLEEFLHRDVCDIFVSQARADSLDFHFGLDDSARTVVRGDRQSVRQVLINILGNALKFTDQGSISVDVWRNKMFDGKWVHICVADTGIGMDENELKRIFSPFVQGDESNSRKYQGTGLGLTIVGKLLQRIGGSLCVESEPGRGSTFWISLQLPVTGDSTPEKDVREAVEVTAAAETAFRALRVLVAEDNRVNLVAIRKCLEHLGHEPVMVTDGVQVVEALRGKDFDCVLMDVQMPVMDGIEATKRIRNDVSGTLPKDIPIIAVTAHALEGDREVLLEAGMTGYLTKPLSLQKLKELLAGIDA